MPRRFFSVRRVIFYAVAAQPKVAPAIPATCLLPTATTGGSTNRARTKLKSRRGAGRREEWLFGALSMTPTIASGW